MEKISLTLGKLFGGIEMTWKRLVIFAAAAGVYTALMALLVPEKSSFHDIAVYIEAWILFAIIIITNCKTAGDAALKTFVFFLISQPLVYLIQVPFVSLGWGIFMYYKYWFIATLLTLPGAFIGWYIKKDNVLSGIILSVMLMLLAYMGVHYAKGMPKTFPGHMLSMIFSFALIPVLILFVLKNKKAKIAAAAISLAAFAVIAVSSAMSPTMELITGINLDPEKYPIDASWTVETEDESISLADFVEMPDGQYALRVIIHEPGPNNVTMKDGNGNEYRLIISYSEDQGVTVLEPDVLPDSE